MNRKSSITHNVAWSAAFIIFVVVTLAITFLGINSPSIAILTIIVILSCFGLVILLTLPEPTIGFEKKCFSTLLLFLLLLIVWPRYLLLRLPGLPGLTPTRVAFVFLMVMWLYMVIKSSVFRTLFIERIKAARTITILLLVLIVVQFLSLFVSTSLLFSGQALSNDLVSGYMLFPITLTLVVSEERIKLFTWTLFVAFILVAVVGLCESAIHHNIFLGHFVVDSDYMAQVFSEKIRSGGNRIQSTFSHPLTFAEFLSLVIPFILMIACQKGLAGYRQLLAFGGLALSMYLVIKTGSRSGAVGFIAAFTSFTFLSLIRYAKSTRDVAKVGMVIVTICISFVIFTSVTYALSDFIIGKTFSEYRSGMARLYMWKYGLDLMAKQPLLGYGHGMAPLVLGYRGGVQNQITIDSYYLNLLLDGGVFALFVYIFMLFKAVMFSARTAICSNRNIGNYAAAVASSLIAFIVIKYVLSLSHNHGLVFALIGVAVSIDVETQRSKCYPEVY